MSPISKRGEKLKVDGDWEDAVGRSLKVKPPKSGWPKPKAMPQRAKKTTKKK